MAMKFESIFIALCIAVLLGTVLYVNHGSEGTRVVRYNCDMAEFHPDYPPAVKEKCRELRNENRTSK